MDHPKFRTDASGDLYLNFGAYGREVEVACFSGDGRRLLTVQEVGVARVWDVASGRLVGEVRPGSPLAGSQAGPTTGAFEVFVEAAALDPAGDLALLGLNDGTAGLFSVADGTRRTTFHHPDRPPAQGWELIRAVDFAPDGSLAVVGFYGRGVGVWDVASGRPVAFVRSDVGARLHRADGWGRDTLVSSVAVAADNRHVFAGHADLTATLWELDTGRVVFDAYEHREKVLALWSAGDAVRWAASGGVVWEGSSAGCVRRLETGECWAEAAFAPDGSSLLVRTAVGQVKRWSLGGQAEVLADLDPDIRWPRDARSLGFAPGGRACYYPLAQSRLAVASERARADLALQQRNDKVAFGRGGELLATYDENRVRFWAVPTGEQRGELAEAEGFWTVAFSPDGALLAAGTLGQTLARDHGPPRTISLWDVARRRLVCRWPAHGHQIRALAFLPDGRHLASAGLDRTVRLWRLPGRKGEAPAEVARVCHDDLCHERLHALSDGRLLVFRDGGVEVWRELRERVLELPIAVEYDTLWQVSADERALLVARDGQVVEVWCLGTGRLLARHAAPVPRPDVVPDGRLRRERPFTAGGCLWRTAAGNFVHVSDGPRGWATPLRLAPDGRSVVLPGREGASVVELGPEPGVAQDFAFEGRLRASCVTEDRVLAVNAAGRVFQAARVR